MEIPFFFLTLLMESHSHDKQLWTALYCICMSFVLIATAHSFHDLHCQVMVLQFDFSLKQTQQLSYVSFIQF
jgi:hypothetical protein